METTTKKKLTPQERYRIKQKIEKLKKELAVKKKQAREARARVREYEEKNKLHYFGVPGKGYLGEHGTWEPNVAQKVFIKEFLNTNYRIYAQVGGNQQGKTTMETVLALACLRGCYPWEDPNVVGRHIWTLRKWKPPIYIRWVGGGWQEHIQKNLIDQNLLPLWPRSWKVKITKNNMGVDYLWDDLETGGQIQFMSHNQARKAFAGWKGNAIFYDEPFDADIWAENLRGIVAKGGIVFIGASLVEENQSWIDDEILQNSVTVGESSMGVFQYTASIHVNIGHGLTQQNVDEFESMLSEEERQVRIYGEAAGKRAKVLKLKDHHFVLGKTIKDIPADYINDFAIDYHPNKPQQINVLSTGPYNVKYMSHEIISEFGKSAGWQWIGSELVRCIKKYNLRVGRIIIDPLSKGGQNALESDGDTVYSRLSDYLAGHGHMLETASKHKEDGIIEINAKLNPQQGPPALYVYKDSCPVSSRQLKKWRYDEFGKPIKEDDEAGENLYRLVNLDTEYYLPEDEEDTSREAHMVTRSAVTGY